MALVVKDRVRETSTTQGTGTFTLAGAVTGYQSFSAIGNGNTTYYTIYLQASNEWEVGIGTYTASGTTLSRDTILASSNGGSVVNFSAGTKDVFVTYPAGRSVYYDTATNVTVNALTLSGGSANGVLYLDASKVATSGSALTFDATTLNFGGASQRITGDFSNATHSNRLLIQSNVVNGNTIVGIIPNGTATTGQLNVYSAAGAANTSVGQFTNNGTTVNITSNIVGSGTYLPLVFSAGGNERVRITTTGGFETKPIANGHAVFNEDGVDADFRVESDTDTHCLFVDASADAVAIGGSAIPVGKLYVNSGSALTVAAIQNAATGAYLAMADNATPTWSAAPKIGAINVAMTFQTNSTEKMRLLSGGQLNLGGNFTSTNNTLQITGNAAIGYTTAAPTTGLIVAGNVGIGTDTVGQRLTVVATANDIAQFQNSVSYGTVLQINATATGGRNWKLHATANGDGVLGGGYFSIIDATANAYRLSIDLSGGVITRPSANGHAVFNEDSVDADFRVESDANTHRLFVDAGADTVLMGTTTNTNSSKLVVDGSISETVSSTQYLVASQYDIGTAANEIPLNQYLGNLAYQDASSIAGQVGLSAGTAALPSLVSATDLDTGMWFPAANTLAWSTGGTERVRIDSAGNVGIGTNAPAFKVDVINNATYQLRLADTTANYSNAGIFLGASGTSDPNYWGALRYVQSDQTLRLVHQAFNAVGGITFYTGTTATATEKARIDSFGNLGIGTSSPSQKLDVLGTIAVRASTSGANQTVNVLRAINSDNSAYANAEYYANSHRWAYAGSTEGMRLDSSGNLGLGAAPGSPAYGYTRILDVAGQFPGVKFTPSGASTFGFQIGAGTNGFQFYDVAASAERMRIDSSGNVGIGTNSPSTYSSTTSPALTVVGAVISTNGVINSWDSTTGGGANVGGNIAFGGNDGSVANRTFALIKGGKENGTSGNYASYLGFFTRENGAAPTERARITSGGYFKASNDGTYYGSTGSQHELRNTANGEWVVRAVSASATDPNGMEIRYSAATPNGTANRFLYCLDSTALRAEIRSNGGLANYSANDVNLASDLRLKNTIEPMRSYYDVFKNINWVTWLYNDQTDDLKNHGVIAQELQELAPEFVCESNAKEAPEGEAPYLGIWEQDFKMAGMSVITELIKKIEKLEAEVAALKGV